MQKLTIDELEEISKRLIKYLRWCGVKEISFPPEEDFYLKIYQSDKKIIYDDKLMKSPPYAIGVFSEDIKGLKELLPPKSDLPSNLDLERLGALLTALGETIVLQE